MKKSDKEIINKAINGTKDIMIKCGKMIIPMLCTAVCNYVCKSMVDGYNVNLKVDKVPVDNSYVPDNATFSDAVYAVSNSTMTSYDKKNTIQSIRHDENSDYYKSIIHIARSTSTSYDRYSTILGL